MAYTFLVVDLIPELNQNYTQGKPIDLRILAMRKPTLVTLVTIFLAGTAYGGDRRPTLLEAWYFVLQKKEITDSRPEFNDFRVVENNGNHIVTQWSDWSHQSVRLTWDAADELSP
jgi:hypothetical protein